MIERGIPIEIHKADAKHVGALDAQKKYQKGIFGSGYLLSDRAAADRAAADRENVIIWELSEKEKEIISQLGKK